MAQAFWRSNTSHSHPSTRHFPHGAWSFSGWAHVHIIVASKGKPDTLAEADCLELTPGTVHTGPPCCGAGDGAGRIARRVRGVKAARRALCSHREASAQAHP